LVRIARVAVAVSAIAVIGFPTGGGASALRGGNHGCSTATGVLFSDHFFSTGDRVIGGFYTEEDVGFPASDRDTLLAENVGGDGEPASLDCNADSGTWKLFTSALGPGKDKVRLDAVGLQRKYIVQPGPLPKSIDSLLKGGSGRDRLRGHLGFDKFRGGSGRDVIKAVDGKKDTVGCGPGNDKAVVDRKDQVSGCERVVEREQAKR
jgi:hypothetical protein